MLKNKFLSTDTTCEKIMRLQDNQMTGWREASDPYDYLSIDNLGKRMLFDVTHNSDPYNPKRTLRFGGFYSFSDNVTFGALVRWCFLGPDPFTNGSTLHVRFLSGTDTTPVLVSISSNGGLTFPGTISKVFVENTGEF